MAREIDGYSETELALLTPDERAALEADDDTPAQGEDGDNDGRNLADLTRDTTMPTDTVLEAAQDDADGKEPEKEDEPDEADASAADAGDTAAEAAATADTQLAEGAGNHEAVAAASTQPFMPYRTVPEKRDWESLTADVAKRYDDGEISTAEYTKQIAQITREEASYHQAIQYNHDLERARWDWEQATFFDAHKEYAGSRARMAALNEEVKRQATLTENAGKTGAQILVMAHAAVVADLGDARAAAPKPPETKRPVARKPDLSTLPTTLAHVPAAAEENTGEDKYAALDRLSGLELERALAKLPEAEQEVYLRGL